MASIRSLLKYVLLTQALSSFHGAQVDPEVFQSLEREGVACIIVEFGSDMVEEAVDCYERKKRSAEAETFEDLASELKGIAKRSQARAISAIHETSRSTGKTNSRGKPSFKLYDMHQLWSTNELVIRNADKTLITQLSEMPEVLSIKSDVSVPFESTECWSEDSDDSSQNGRGVENSNTTETTESTPTTEGTDSTTTQFPDQKIETTTPYPLPPDPRWNMKMADVSNLWRQQVFGEGVVVGIVSSGVNFFHEAVRTKYRSENGWFDPVNGGKLPYDDSSLEIGTRTASIILGGTTADGYGVAPLAKWIACRAMHKDRYTLSNLKICMQFMACPTDPRNKNPDCTLRPRVVHIPLGFFYNENRTDHNALGSIKILKAARTIVIWAIGDAFARCDAGFVETTDPYVISVAALDDKSVRPYYSSRGILNKTTNKPATPTIAAPGGPIYAATSRDNQYKYDNKSRGTFVAAAHVAGIAALLLQTRPNVTASQMKYLLNTTAFAVPKTNIQCDNFNDNLVPNVFIGNGVVQAHTAWNYMLHNWNMIGDKKSFFTDE